MRLRVFQKPRDTLPKSETGTAILHGRQIDFILIRSARRRRTVAFMIDPNMRLRVLAPLRAKLPVIHALLQKRASWILSKFDERKKIHPVNKGGRFTEGGNIIYLGQAYRLRVTQDSHAPQGCHLRPRIMAVNIADTALSEKALQQEVRLEILLWIKKRARMKLKKRMDLWAGRLGVDYKKMLVTDPQRQWGSCSADNVVRLCWRLMLAPLPLIDYVVAHELAHVVHKNHSPRFWKFLANAMPDFHARRKKLRKIGAGLVL